MESNSTSLMTVYHRQYNPLMLIYIYIYICSIIGGAVVILGLYMLLWGKGKDQIDKSSTEHQSERDGDQSEASSAGP